MRNIDPKFPPWCPFCKQEVERPQPPDTRKLGEFPVGTCQCGAVYTSDPTGHNVGAAMIDALVHACGGNWDLAWDLLPEEDYLTSRVESYDEQTHQVVETRNLDGRLIRGVLYFVRLLREVAAIPAAASSGAAGVEEKGSGLEPAPDPKRVKKRADKTQVKQMMMAEDYDGLVALCFDDSRTIRFMQRQLYSPDEEGRWQAVHVVGVVCGRVATRRPGMVSDLLHSLFNASADSSSASWGAIETIGAIVANRTDIFGAFAPHLLRFINSVGQRVPVLWALGTIAGARPDIIRKLSIYSLFSLLDSPDPMLKGLTLRLLGRIRAQEISGRIKGLVADETALCIYEQGRQVRTTIGALAREAAGLIAEQGDEK